MKLRVDYQGAGGPGAEPRPARTTVSDRAAVVARWVLGGVFIYMGWHKVSDPVGFLKLVRQYELVANPLWLNTIAATLPWFEVFCGVLLVAGVAVRGAALVTLAMLIPFSIVVLNRALGISAEQHLRFCDVRFDCGCGAGVMIICTKLLENCGLGLLSALLLSGRGRQLSLRYELRPPARASAPG